MPEGGCDRYQLAAGHHRFEAQMRMGAKEISLSIRDFSSDAMIHIMGDENVSKGAGWGAFLNVVAAAYGRITYLALIERDKELEGLLNSRGQLSPGDGRCAGSSVRGHLARGDGVGWKSISAYLNGKRVDDGKVDSSSIAPFSSINRSCSSIVSSLSPTASQNF